MSDNSKKEDMTRIEDLSEFLHSEDSDLDNQFLDEEPPPFNETIAGDDTGTQTNFKLPSDEDSLESNDFDESTSEELSFTDASLENNFEENTDSFDESDSSFEDSNDFDQNEAAFSNDLEDSSDFSSENITYEDNANEVESEEEENEDTLQSGYNAQEYLDESVIIAPTTFSETSEDFDYPEVSHEDASKTETSDNTYSTSISTRENFKEIQDFGNAISYGKVQSGGNPAFSIMLKGIDSEDFESILSILNEHGLIGQNEGIIKQSLELGVLLIAQVSEFSAIFLANKLKQYSTDISIGLSEQIHKSKSYDKDNKGLVTKKSIFQNKDKKYIRENNRFKLEDIIVTKNGQIPNTIINEHFGVIASSKVVSFADLTRQDLSYSDDLKDAKLEINSLAIYDDLIKELSISAFEKGANAILSVTHSMSSLVEKDEYGEVQYQIICSGDAVVVDKI